MQWVGRLGDGRRQLAVLMPAGGHWPAGARMQKNGVLGPNLPTD